MMIANRIRLMVKPKGPSKKQFPERASEVPVTQAMLFAVRDELKSDIASFDHKFTARFKEIDARFDRIEARFNGIEGKFNGIEARFNEHDARFERIEAKINEGLAQNHKMLLLLEEQNARNRIVMDGLNILFDRQERLEKKIL